MQNIPVWGRSERVYSSLRTVLDGADMQKTRSQITIDDYMRVRAPPTCPEQEYFAHLHEKNDNMPSKGPQKQATKLGRATNELDFARQNSICHRQARVRAPYLFRRYESNPEVDQLRIAFEKEGGCQPDRWNKHAGTSRRTAPDPSIAGAEPFAAADTALALLPSCANADAGAKRS